MTALTDFYDYLLPNLPNVGTDLARQALREALIEFCEKSLIWAYEMPAVNVVGGTHTYALAPEANARPVDVLDVWYSGTPLTPATPAELDALYTDWRTVGGTGIPKYFTSLVGLANIRLVKTPADSITGGLTITIAQAPSLTATDVPDWLFEDHHMTVSHGAWARLLRMPRRPWTDKEAAREYEASFEQGCGQANARKAKAHTRKPVRVRGRFR